MSSKRKKAKAVPFNPADVANIAKTNPYIQRLIEDAKLRDNVQKAIESTQERVWAPVERQGAGQGAARGQEAAEGPARGARGGPRRVARADRGAEEAGPQGPRVRPQAADRRASAAALALAGSEKLRSKVLDTLFGAEEEFEYTPPRRHARRRRRRRSARPSAARRRSRLWFSRAPRGAPSSSSGRPPAARRAAQERGT